MIGFTSCVCGWLAEEIVEDAISEYWIILSLHESLLIHNRKILNFYILWKKEWYNNDGGNGKWNYCNKSNDLGLTHIPTSQ